MERQAVRQMTKSVGLESISRPSVTVCHSEALAAVVCVYLYFSSTFDINSVRKRLRTSPEPEAISTLGSADQVRPSQIHNSVQLPHIYELTSPPPSPGLRGRGRAGPYIFQRSKTDCTHCGMGGP